MGVNEIEDLHQLLQRLKKVDTKLRVFGADEHQYQFPPPLNESILEEFERRHQIKLPSDYRLFLTHTGNGGPGPDYGVASFEDACAWGGCNVSEPFPWTEGFSWHSKEDFEAHREEARIWAKYPGVVEVCDSGCSFYSFLVVNGAAYGTVWDVSERHLAPTGLTFGAWYRRWVEKSLQILANEPLVERIQIGMTKIEVIAATGGDWQQRQALGRRITFLENSLIPAQLELDEEDKVVKINHWTSI